MKLERNQESLSGGEGGGPALVMSARSRNNNSSETGTTRFPLRPQANPVGLDLRVEGGGVHSQQARGT